MDGEGHHLRLGLEGGNDQPEERAAEDHHQRQQQEIFARLAQAALLISPTATGLTRGNILLQGCALRGWRMRCGWCGLHQNLLRLVIAVYFIVDPETAETEHEQRNRENEYKKDPEHCRAIAKALVGKELHIDIDHVEEIAPWHIKHPGDGIGLGEQK